MSLVFVEGDEAVALGAIHAGCRFFASYPITPASSLLAAMLEALPPLGGTVLQGEDEIASIGYCLGASMAGLKAMTATSGPGLSLYSENLLCHRRGDPGCHCKRHAPGAVHGLCHPGG